VSEAAAIDPATLAAIAAMALTTYATRVAGLFLHLSHEPGPRAQAALDSTPSRPPFSSPSLRR
jgi:uncharacterized membrane protein